MAITTLDGAIAGMQPPVAFSKAIGPTMVGPPFQLSTWYLAGNPGAGLAPANTSGGVGLTAPVAGQLSHTNPGAGNAYLARLTGMATIPGMLMLCDRLVQCQGTTAGAAINNTTSSGVAQTVNTNPLPARDATGTSNGAGVLAALEYSAACGAGTPTVTLGYTGWGANGTATAGHSATLANAIAASGPLGSFWPFGLQAGDIGIQSIQTINISATMTSGTVALVLYRVLAALELAAAYIPNARRTHGGLPATL